MYSSFAGFISFQFRLFIGAFYFFTLDRCMSLTVLAVNEYALDMMMVEYLVHFSLSGLKSLDAESMASVVCKLCSLLVMVPGKSWNLLDSFFSKI